MPGGSKVPRASSSRRRTPRPSTRRWLGWRKRRRVLHWRWFGRGQRSWVASRWGRRPVLVVGLPDLHLGRWLGWGRRVLHWRWLGRRKGSWVAPRRGLWRSGGVPASRAMHWWGLGRGQGSRVAPWRGGWRRGCVSVSRVLRWWGLGRRRGGQVAPRRGGWRRVGVSGRAAHAAVVV